MMDLFTLLSLVIVVQFVGASNGADVINQELGASFSMWSSRYGQKVIVLSAKHDNASYNLLDELTDDHIKYRESDDRYEFYLNNITYDHAGEWEINSLVSSSEKENRNQDIILLRVIKSNQKLLPTNYIVGEEGSYATVYFEKHFDNIKSCYLESHRNSKKYILGDKRNGVDGLEIYGKCGVRMRLNSSWPTEWTLNQENNNHGVMSARFTINYKPELTPTVQKSELWHIGSDQTIIGMSSEVNFCKIEKPNGLIISLDEYRCAYTVKDVNMSHAGTWKLHYVPTYSMNVVNQNIKVTVVDPQKVNWVITQKGNGPVHLQCQTFLEDITYCLFKSPSGELISVMPALGNEKYEYYGTTHRTVAGRNYSQCGLTIRDPSDYVDGLWTCTFESAKGSLLASGTYVSGNLVNEVDDLRVTTNSIFVKLGEKFTIKCETERPLDYCLLRSPNGTIYSVTKNRGNVPNHLPYTGEGLSVGVCGAYIEEAHKAHDGDWTCRLGVSSEDSEIEANVSVTVTEAYVVAPSKIIDVEANKKPKLVVSVSPNEDLTVKYCRWVRPNGERISKANVPRFIRKQSGTSCSLTLKEIHPGDLGIWSCYVGFNTGPDAESHTTIELVKK